MKRHGTIGLLAALALMGSAPQAHGEPSVIRRTFHAYSTDDMPRVTGIGGIRRTKHGRPTPKRVRHRNPKHARQRAKHCRKLGAR